MNIRLSLLALLAALSLPLHAADGIHSQTVRFAAGTSSAQYQQTLTGHEVRAYVLRARQGQVLVVGLRGPGSTNFNVLDAGDDTALFNGALDGPDARVTLPRTGLYTVRVYQMGQAKSARRTTRYQLNIAVRDTPPAHATPHGAGSLADLVGARAAGGETQLQARGYVNVGGGKRHGHSDTVWWNAAQQRCVAVTTANGRYQRIDEAAAARCNAG
ncbi:hypothetical protein [Chitiniphilus shinanonensis]|uniref:hypothetical protein n=1 Tax=Chitiniphilus shinanonensis TaxID=553088 RepID=UPI00306F212C